MFVDLNQLARNGRGRGECRDGALQTLTCNSGSIFSKEKALKINDNLVLAPWPISSTKCVFVTGLDSIIWDGTRENLKGWWFWRKTVGDCCVEYCPAYISSPGGQLSLPGPLGNDELTGVACDCVSCTTMWCPQTRVGWCATIPNLPHGREFDECSVCCCGVPHGHFGPGVSLKFNAIQWKIGLPNLICCNLVCERSQCDELKTSLVFNQLAILLVK